MDEGKSKYCSITKDGKFVVSSILFDQRTSQYRRIDIIPHGIRKDPNSLKFLGECISDLPK